MFTATITGRIGTVKETQNVGNSQVRNFSVAHNFKKGEGYETVWYDAALWGSRAESLSLNPGDTVTISTTEAITAHLYEGQNGQAVSLKITVDQIHITPKAQDNN